MHGVKVLKCVYLLFHWFHVYFKTEHTEGIIVVSISEYYVNNQESSLPGYLYSAVRVSIQC